ncbi:MAG: response regulator transcription factor [Burkholderiales bacterium]
MSRVVATSTQDADVFAITDKGNAELKSAGTRRTVAELEILILIDGKANVARIAEMAKGQSRDDVNGTLKKLYAEKLITTATEPTSDGLESGYFSIAVPAGFFSSLAAEAAPEVETGLSTLTQRGYYVRIARRPEKEREFKQGWRPTVLVIDDDPDILKLVVMFFKFDGFIPRIARKRDEIMLAFKQEPMPDLVVLDVELPDANGFDILAKMRLHPLLKSVPVIMLTATSTREAVIKGLQGGADGYVTKPFEPDLLMTAIKSVLDFPGKKPPPEDKKKTA